MASVNRGCLAISEGGDGGGRGGTSGGARTEVLDDGVTRAPCIAMPNIRLASELRRVRACMSTCESNMAWLGRPWRPVRVRKETTVFFWRAAGAFESRAFAFFWEVSFLQRRTCFVNPYPLHLSCSRLRENDGTYFNRTMLLKCRSGVFLNTTVSGSHRVPWFTVPRHSSYRTTMCSK